MESDVYSVTQGFLFFLFDHMLTVLLTVGTLPEVLNSTPDLLYVDSMF